MNTIGTTFRFTSFGESHGHAIGGVLDGVPAGIRIDLEMIREALARRAGRIGSVEDSSIGTSPRARRESDEVEWLSGVLDGVTLGTPIAFIIRNTDARPEDYLWLQDSYRPGHADWVYQQKYGIRDYRGGGRASARETVSRVVAGEIARKLLLERGIKVHATLTQIGEEEDPTRFEPLLKEVQQAGDSIGGIVSCTITGLGVGVGEPIFDKLSARLAAAMLSINGCKGFDYDLGFESLHYRGSAYIERKESISGGISTGEPIRFRAVFKPAATIAQRYKGRHDVCIAIRAVPVVEAMTNLVLIDMLYESAQ